MTARAALLVTALALGGCGRNAVFELELDLPPQPAGATRFAFVQASETRGFDEPGWDDAGAAALGPLPEACARPAPTCAERALDPRCSAVVSVVADDTGSGPLRLRVRLCQSPRCTLEADAAAPEARIEVERAFYSDRFTQARVCVDEVPADALDVAVARCEVRCRDGVAASHCRADGTHFCEE